MLIIMCFILLPRRLIVFAYHISQAQVIQNRPHIPLKTVPMAHLRKTVKVRQRMKLPEGMSQSHHRVAPQTRHQRAASHRLWRASGRWYSRIWLYRKTRCGVNRRLIIMCVSDHTLQVLGRTGSQTFFNYFPVGGKILCMNTFKCFIWDFLVPKIYSDQCQKRNFWYFDGELLTTLNKVND